MYGTIQEQWWFLSRATWQLFMRHRKMHDSVWTCSWTSSIKLRTTDSQQQVCASYITWLRSAQCIAVTPCGSIYSYTRVHTPALKKQNNVHVLVRLLLILHMDIRLPTRRHQGRKVFSNEEELKISPHL